MRIIRGTLTLLVPSRAAVTNGSAPSHLRVPSHTIVPGALHDDWGGGCPLPHLDTNPVGATLLDCNDRGVTSWNTDCGEECRGDEIKKNMSACVISLD